MGFGVNIEVNLWRRDERDLLRLRMSKRIGNTLLNPVNDSRFRNASQAEPNGIHLVSHREYMIAAIYITG